MHRKLCRVAALCLLLPWSSVFAEDGEDRNLLELSLEELLNVEVTVASKKAESIHDAPGIITVISRQEIEGFAAENLGQVLNRVVGTAFLSPDVFSNQTLMFRGQEVTPYNNHTLILLNGRPLRDPISGGLNGVVWNGFPLDAIDQIEIIRGPGSVLYGSCAYSGVINIITNKHTSEPLTGGVSARAGSYSAFAQNANLRFGKGELKGNLGFSHYDDDGPEFEFTDYRNVHSSDNFYRGGYGMVTTMNYRDFSLNAYLGNYEPYSLNGSEYWDPGYHNDHKLTNFDLGYNHKFGDRFSLSLNGTYNKHHWESALDAGVTEGTSNLYEATGFIHPNDKLNIVVGGGFEATDWGGVLVNSGEQDSNFFYTQIDYAATEQIKLIGGVQYNKIQRIDGHASPRVGVVGHFNERWGGKLLYSEAFRRAYPLETSFAIIVFRGNPDLAPELIQTTEAQLFYTGKTGQVSITLFKSHMSDIISRKYFDAPELRPPFYLQYLNGGTWDFEGLEFEGKWSFSKQLLGTANASYQTNERAGVDDATLHPNEMVKLGLLYNTGAWSLGVFNTYVGASQSTTLVNPGSNVANPEADAYNLLSAKYRAHLTKLGQGGDLSLSLEVDNLLDKEITYVDYPNKQVNTLIPLYEGMVWAGSLNLRF